MAATEKPVLAKYKDRMDKAVAVLKEEFGSLRTGRASASLLDQISVEAYGSTVPINQVGAINVPEARISGNFTHFDPQQWADAILRWHKGFPELNKRRRCEKADIPYVYRQWADLLRIAEWLRFQQVPF